MSILKLPLLTLVGLLITEVSHAQLFETRTTRFATMAILDSLNASGHQAQIDLRDSVLEARTAGLAANDSIETYFDDHYMGLVIYRDRKPHELIGFWDPEGNPVSGGSLQNGTGTVKTPFNPDIVKNFASESVEYQAGMKNGPVFYYCDCASVLRRGTFNNNQKEGLWKEYTPSGKFIKQKRIKIEQEPVDVKERKDDRWLQPSHCMMRNPNDVGLECPKG